MRRATVAGVLAIALLGCGGGEPAAAPLRPADDGPKAVSVRVAAVQARDIDRAIEISGSLGSPEAATIAAEVDGKVITIGADLGDEVRKGQTMARINAGEYRARLIQATAQREQTHSNLTRVEQLARTNVATPQQLDEARSAAAQARAAEALALHKVGVSVVRAPFAGAIAKRMVSPGEYVHTGQPLFELVILRPLQLTGQVPERMLSLVHVGDRLAVQVDAFSDRTFMGSIARIAPAIDPASRSFAIEATVDDEGGLLRPGLFARAELRAGVERGALVVPEAAVTTFAGVSRVYEIEGNVAHERQVEIGQRLPDGGVELRGAALMAGDQVAVAGLARLAEGVAVSPR